MNDLTKNPHVKFLMVVIYVAIGYFVAVNWLPKLFIWLLPFLLAFFVAYMTRPVVRFLTEKWRLPEKLSAIISLLLVLLTVGSVIGYLITKIVIELINLAVKIPSYLVNLPDYINYITGWIQVYKANLSPEIASLFENSVVSLTDSIKDVLVSLSKQILNSATNFATEIPGIGIFFLVFIVSSVFFCIDYRMIVDTLKKQLHPASRKRVLEIKGYTLTAVTKYLRGVIIITSVIYVVLLIGLLIMQINYAYLFAFIIAILDMLPLIGAGLFLIPWGIFQMLSGNIILGIGLIALSLTISTVRQLIEPKIMSKSLGLYPLITLLSIYIGLKSVGFAGMILFPITVLVLVYLHRAGAIKLWRTDDSELPD